MPRVFKPHDYQVAGTTFLVENESALLFYDPGLGKTVTTLTALKYLFALGEAKRALVFAPLHVIYNVWPQECRKWKHLSGLKSVVVHADNPTDRTVKLLEALETDANVFLVNAEASSWLVDTKLRPYLKRFDVLVVDELSKFKSASSDRFKALRKVVPNFRYRWGLTGTPAPNSYKDLWSQTFIVDAGERLGKTVSYFNRRYCRKGGFQGKEWLLNAGSDKKIEAKIKDIVLRGDADEFLDLPDLLVNDVLVDLPPKIRKAYDSIEEDFIAELEDGREIVSESASGKYLLLRQIANGGYYDESGKANQVHDAKTNAVNSIVEELSGKPAIIAYQFEHDLDRLRAKFGKSTPVINGKSSAKDVTKIVNAWNKDRIEVLLAQPAAMSHGLNMQDGNGRDFIFYGLTDSLEVYEQAYKRIYRQGVDSAVRVHRILAKNTVDFAMRKRIDNKALMQKSFLDAMKGR